MLEEQDVEWLMQSLAATAELLGQKISPVAVEMMAADLDAYPMAVLSAALKRVRTEHVGALTLKAIIDRIDAVMGRPGANEAWATALTALDERNTVVWTEEMAKAWEVARPLAVGGDEIGARMAFKDAYERLCRAAREERRMPVVTISNGWDAQGRAVAVQKAAALGYMSTTDALAYGLPPPAFNVAALLAGRLEVADHAPPDLRRRLIAMRDDFMESDKRRASEREMRAAQEAAELLLRKAEVQKMADEYDEAAVLRRAEWAAVQEKAA